MRRLTILLAAILVVASALPSQPVVAQSSPAGVTGAGRAIFPSGTLFSGVSLSGLRFGQGLFIPGDGSAAGQFEIDLLGTSVLGQPQNITVEGQVSSGSISVGVTSATFSGSATVDMGDGSLPLTGVPFTVTTTPTGLLVTLGTTNLPAATVTVGSITIQ